MTCNYMTASILSISKLVIGWSPMLNLLFYRMRVYKTSCFPRIYFYTLDNIVTASFDILISKLF